MERLDPRKEVILKAVIIEYVATAEPIGSERLAQKYELGVRSATVRNELSEMSDLGYLEQPHTSAGRIPSDTGYRYYVDRIVHEKPPAPDEQAQVLNVAQRSEVLHSILQHTTKLVSRLTHQLTAATVESHSKTTIRSAIVTALGHRRLLLVLILNNGDVANRMMECSSDTTLEAIGVANSILSESLRNMTLKQVSKAKAPSVPGHPVLESILQSVYANLKVLSSELSGGKLLMEGEEYILAQPELRRSEEVLREVLSQIEDEAALTQAVGATGGDQVSVSIGKENETDGLKHLTIMRHRYSVGGEDAGTLAIIGPTRQDYERNLAILNFAAKAISHALAEDVPE